MSTGQHCASRACRFQQKQTFNFVPFKYRPHRRQLSVMHPRLSALGLLCAVDLQSCNTCPASYVAGEHPSTVRSLPRADVRSRSSRVMEPAGWRRRRYRGTSTDLLRTAGGPKEATDCASTGKPHSRLRRADTARCERSKMVGLSLIMPHHRAFLAKRSLGFRNAHSVERSVACASTEPTLLLELHENSDGCAYDRRRIDRARSARCCSSRVSAPAGPQRPQPTLLAAYRRPVVFRRSVTAMSASDRPPAAAPL